MTGDPPAVRVGRYRWMICGLLFAATAINYIDRQTIGVLKPTLQAELKWTESSYADIVVWFQAAYAIGYLSFGPLIDRIGARLGYAIAFSIWTLAHIAHGFVHTITQFALVRFTLGLGESGGFPSSLKAVSEWFPQQERALAVGVFNAGSNVGAIITPLVVPIITLIWGWRAAFVVTGGVTFVWLIAWLAMYRNPASHSKVSASELAYIRGGEGIGSAGPSQVAVSWPRLLTVRETWAYALGKFLTDPIWWLYLFWLPDFLSKRYNLDLQSFGPPLVAIYLLSDVGSVLGGWGSSRLMKRGRSANVARKIMMSVCAVAVIPIVFAQFVSQLWVAVAIIGVATASHQAWSANLMTLPSDMFPRVAVGSVVGIGGTAGAIGGMLMSKYNGYILDVFGSYQPIFAIAGGAYIVGIVVIHSLSPRLQRVSEQRVTTAVSAR
jgi:ACS family hexuronate transporter-like MFS transporter